MKTTVTNVTEFFKSTKGAKNFTIISFNAETKVRTMAYIGYEMMGALTEMALMGAQGNICILTNAEGVAFMDKFESENHRRVSFNDMKPYRVLIDINNETNRYGLRSGANVFVG